MKTLIVVDLGLARQYGQLTLTNLEMFTDELVSIIDAHGLQSDMNVSACVRLVDFDDDGNELPVTGDASPPSVG